MTVLLVYCSCPNDGSAKTIARKLVESRLAAGVNVIPGLWSIYHWQNEIETADEHLLLIETRKENYEALEKRLTELHPYELPKIVAVPIGQGLTPYLQWIEDNSKTP